AVDSAARLSQNRRNVPELRIHDRKQGSRSHAAVLDPQDRVDDARRDRGRRRFDVARSWLSRRHRDLRGRVCTRGRDADPRGGMFYWLTILFSQTLGTALGDWTADSAGLGYTGAMLIFGALLIVLVALYYGTSVSRTVLFWCAFVLTRPLGAVVGDFLDKPV